MSSTPVRRRGPSSRPARSAASETNAAAAGLNAELAGARLDAKAFARAFPVVRIDADTVALLVILALSLVMRLIMLGDRPLHHDESLHATYSWYLMGRTNPEYHYDPMMHGPLQFHMMAFFYSIFGSSVFSARLWSVTAGTALVAVPWLLRRQFGRWPMFALMGMLSLSPIALYFSRFAREDMQFALFTFLMIAALIRYIADRQDGIRYHYRWLYVLGMAIGMAYAAKESIYLNIAMLGAFLALLLTIELLRGAWLATPFAAVILVIGGIATHHLAVSMLGAILVTGVMVYHLMVSERSGPVSMAVRDTPAHAWALGAAAIVVLFFTLYWPIGDPASWAFVPGSNPVHTTLDIPGHAQPEQFTYSTDGLTGGLLYWQAQQPVARGGQPWFYYFLVVPLYEWMIVLFGIVGMVYVLVKQRTLAGLLVVWWTVASWAIYGWTSEKMPWNALHLVVPLAVLAAIGLVAGVTAARRWLRYLAIVAALITGLLSTHNALTLSYVNGASPVEYMVYVQTSPDVPKVYDEMLRIKSHITGPLHLQVDTGNTWPWAFYLRDSNPYCMDSSVFCIDAYPSKAADYGTPKQPVLLMGTENGSYDALSSSLAGRYVAFREDLRWWNPEEYKGSYVDRYKWVQAANQSQACKDATHVTCTLKLESPLERLGDFVGDALSPSTWSNIVQWEIKRKPFSPTAWDNYGNQTDFWFLVRRDLVQYLSPDLQAQVARQDPFLNLTRSLQPKTTLLPSTGSFSSVGPLATDTHGNIFVGDGSKQRIVELSPSGTVVRTWGSAGTGKGQFNTRSPSIGGIAVAPNGNVYVTDIWNYRIQEFKADGTFVRAWGHQNLTQTKLKPDDFYGPRGISVAPNGDVYVADTGHERVQVFDSVGNFKFSIGTSGSATGQFDEPSSVAVGPTGSVYVADYWNSRIQVFDGKGAALTTFPVPAWQPGSYDEPQIAVDTSGRVFVPDPAGSHILVFTSAGKPILAWGGVGSLAGQFTKPTIAVAGHDGTILVGDTGNTRVPIFAAP